MADKSSDNCRVYRDYRGVAPVHPRTLTSRHGEKSILITETGLEEAITWLAINLAKDFRRGNYNEGNEPIVVPMLDGAWYFHADLTRKMSNYNCAD